MRVFDKRKDKTRRRFCSIECQDRWANFMKQEGFIMIDPTKQEQEAMNAVRKPLYELISTEIGLHKSIQDYTMEEMMTVIEVVITAYQDYLFAHFPDNKPPQKKKK